MRPEDKAAKRTLWVGGLCRYIVSYTTKTWVGTLVGRREATGTIVTGKKKADEGFGWYRSRTNDNHEAPTTGTYWDLLESIRIC